MPISIKFKRACEGCHEDFQPNSKQNRLCLFCRSKNYKKKDIKKCDAYKILNSVKPKPKVETTLTIQELSSEQEDFMLESAMEDYRNARTLK